jgi:AcrR family transcriptional regulator
MPRTKAQFASIKHESKAKIKAAGLKLFVERGLLATSVSDIAATAGISKGLLYHYYPAKEDLYYALVEHAIHSACDHMQEISTLELSPAEKIALIAETMIGSIARNDETAQYFVFMNRFLIAENRATEAQKLVEAAYVPIALTQQIIADGQGQGQFRKADSEALSLLFWSTINGLCVHKLILRDKFVAPPPQILVQMLQPRAETPTQHC